MGDRKDVQMTFLVKEGRSVRGTWHRLRSRGAVAALVAAFALTPVLGVAAFQLAPSDPSPATGGARVIAQGVTVVPAEDLAWTLRLMTAETPANAKKSPTVPGFILADTGTILVEEADDCCVVRLGGAEADWMQPDEESTVAALGSNRVDYYRFELAPVADTADPTVIHQSAPFTGSGDAHDIDLVSTSLIGGETLAIPAGAAPTIVLVTSGTAEVSTADGEFVTLEAKNAFSAAGELLITATGESADVVAAVIGPKVPRLSDVAAQTVSNATPVAVGPKPATSDDVDTDGDGLSDVKEEEIFTDALLADTDGDGLSDGDEVRLGTKPLIDDTDGDGVSDGDEAAAGTDPRGTGGDAAVPTAEPVAEPVTEEPTVAPEEPVVEEPVVEEPVIEEPVTEPEPEVLDTDQDGVDDAYELEIGTDPYTYDTDVDGLGDGDELFGYATGPLNPDSDGDGWLDGDEVTNGTDPNDAASFPSM